MSASWPRRVTISWPVAASHSLGRLVSGGGGDYAAVGADSSAGDTSFVAAEDGDSSPRGDIPDAGGLVVGRGDQSLAVGAERLRWDLSLVAAQGDDLLPGSRVPQPDGIVFGDGENRPAIRAEAGAG